MLVWFNDLKYSVCTEADCLWASVRQYCRQHITEQANDWPSCRSNLWMFYWTTDWRRCWAADN